MHTPVLYCACDLLFEPKQGRRRTIDVTEMTLYDTWSGAHRCGGCCGVGVMEEFFSFGTLKYFALL